MCKALISSSDLQGDVRDALKSLCSTGDGAGDGKGSPGPAAVCVDAPGAGASGRSGVDVPQAIEAHTTARTPMRHRQSAGERAEANLARHASVAPTGCLRSFGLRGLIIGFLFVVRVGAMSLHICGDEVQARDQSRAPVRVSKIRCDSHDEISATVED